MVKFHEKAVTKSALRALAILRQHAFIHDFYLAGGTALAIQLGHRVSTDLDWFSTTKMLLPTERSAINQALSATGQFAIVSEQDGMMFTRLLETDVSFIHQQHPLLEPTVDYQGIPLASPTDIGLMKLAAVNSRGSRRDFIDLYCLRDIVTLDHLLALAETKYADRPSFLSIAVRALAYFEDAEQQPIPRLFMKVQWPNVRRYCEDAARRLARKLSGLS